MPGVFLIDWVLCWFVSLILFSLLQQPCPKKFKQFLSSLSKSSEPSFLQQYRPRDKGVLRMRIMGKSEIRVEKTTWHFRTLGRGL